MSDNKCSPGSNPHADQPNWQPATTIAEYIENCEQGLETYDRKHVAKMFGWSSVLYWRIQQVAEIPDALFEQLLTARPMPSLTELSYIGKALRGGKSSADVECCPHCGGVIRLRQRIRRDLAQIVYEFITAKADDMT